MVALHAGDFTCEDTAAFLRGADPGAEDEVFAVFDCEAGGEHGADGVDEDFAQPLAIEGFFDLDGDVLVVDFDVFSFFVGLLTVVSGKKFCAGVFDFYPEFAARHF